LSVFNWHVIRTRSRHEKQIHQMLEKTAIESFLPVQRQRRKWSDRWKWVDIPLFPSYVFVRPTLLQREQVLQTYGVVNYLIFNGRAAIVRQEEIDFLQKVAVSEEQVKVVPDLFKRDKKVLIVKGLFKGYTGRFIRSDGHGVVAVGIDEIGYSVIIKVDQSELAPYPDPAVTEQVVTGLAVQPI